MGGGGDREGSNQIGRVEREGVSAQIGRDAYVAESMGKVELEGQVATCCWLRAKLVRGCKTGNNTIVLKYTC